MIEFLRMRAGNKDEEDSQGQELLDDCGQKR